MPSLFTFSNCLHVVCLTFRCNGIDGAGDDVDDDDADVDTKQLSTSKLLIRFVFGCCASF